MSSEKTTPGVTTEARLITCILPKGRARLIQEVLADEENIHAANYHGARGVGRFTRLAARGIGGQPEKEVLEVCVPADRADALFEKMFFAGQMNEPHGGIIYMTRLARGMEMQLPALPAEEP